MHLQFSAAEVPWSSHPQTSRFSIATSALGFQLHTAACQGLSAMNLTCYTAWLPHLPLNWVKASISGYFVPIKLSDAVEFCWNLEIRSYFFCHTSSLYMPDSNLGKCSVMNFFKIREPIHQHSHLRPIPFKWLFLQDRVFYDEFWSQRPVLSPQWKVWTFYLALMVLTAYLQL